MAINTEQIRALAERVAISHGMDLVDVEFQGNAKFRVLRVFVEKNAAERAKLALMAEAGEVEDLPKGVPAELLSGVTHEDCVQFANDFGTVLDVEDLVPGGEYTLEVSSPGIERKLSGARDYERFRGSLLKLQTFTPVNGNRQWRGRLVGFADGRLTLDPAALKGKGKSKKAGKAKADGSEAAAGQMVEIALANVEKANLLAEM